MTTFAGPAVFPSYFLNGQGDILAGVSFKVYLRGTTTLATLYTDRTKATTAPNPTTTDASGNAWPYTDPGSYDAVFYEGTPSEVRIPFAVAPDAEDVAGPTVVDVRDYGPMVVGTDVRSTIQAALDALLTDSTLGNVTLRLPLGRFYLSGSLTTPNNAANFTIEGSGYRSSLLEWTGGNAPMLKLVNCRGAVLRDFGLVGNATAANRPTYGVQVHRAAGAAGAGKTQVRLKSVFLGGYSSDMMDVAVGYTSDAGQDGDNDRGTFDDVHIFEVRTGYRFGTTNTLWHNIIGGSVEKCSVACIDNIPGPNSSGYGGSYKVFGTRFMTQLTSGVVFRVGPTVGINDLAVYGMDAENIVKLVDVPVTIDTPITMSFFGGHAHCSDPPSGSDDTVTWRHTNNGGLEFHAFSISSPNGVRWHFPSVGGTVRFFGGRTVTKEWKYNNTIARYSLHEASGDVAFTNLGSGSFADTGAGAVVSVNGRTGTVTGLAEAADVLDKSATAQVKVGKLHIGAFDDAGALGTEAAEKLFVRGTDINREVVVIDTPAGQIADPFTLRVNKSVVFDITNTGGVELATVVFGGGMGGGNATIANPAGGSFLIQTGNLDNGNIVFNAAAAGELHHMFNGTSKQVFSANGLGLANASVAPASNPSDGLVAYSEGGYLKVRASDGTVFNTTRQAALADTNGATLAALETEVNAIKSCLRTTGLIAAA